MMRHFLDLFDVTAEEIIKLLKEASRLKKAQLRRKSKPSLRGRVLGMIFEKPSLRTRVSFQAAVAQLGGSSIFLSGAEVGLGSRETVPDFARTVSNYVDAVVLRTFRHQTVEEFALHAGCPVINGLSDYCHPCQALGDLLTLMEVYDEIEGRTLVFVGDGNNVARSLAIGCGKLGVHFVLAAPEGYGFDKPFLKKLHDLVPEADIKETSNPRQAVHSADVVYTDVWASMGQEDEREQRHRKFARFQVNADLMKCAPEHARLMHCLPAHRGEEVTSDVLDGDRSVVFQQAGNRMHAQKALLEWLLK
jgi:ornithine carbamoyltransferase